MPDLSLGYGPAKINVPLPSWAKIKRWLLGKELHEQVYVLLQSASLRIDREGEGVAEFTVWVANLSSKAITLDRVVLHLWTWLSRVLPLLAPVMRGERSVIPKRSIGYLQLTLNMTDECTRIIHEACPVKMTDLLGGNLTLRVDGDLYVLESKLPIHFNFEAHSPQLRFHWLQDRAGGEKGDKSNIDSLA